MGMRTCFVVKVDDYRGAIADLCDYYDLGLMITRINVPEDHRDSGYGTTLLKQITEEADADGMVLFLEILPSGSRTYAELEAWYKKYGFKDWLGIYRRIPRNQ